MPLKTGSDQKTINENIGCILRGYKTPHKEGGTGCGYDPPYKDPARKEYTPAQAAAIAYAKAGKRNNTGGSGGSKKKTKSKQEESKPKSETKPKEESKPKVPEGWNVQKKPAQPAESKSPEDKEADDKMLQEVLDGYKNKFGSGTSLIEETWPDLNPKQKQQYLKQAQKLKAEAEAKAKPAQVSAPEPNQTDKYEKLYEDNKDILEKAYGGNGVNVKKQIWDVLSDNLKDDLLKMAPEIAKKQKQTPAPKDGNNNGGGDTESDDKKMFQDLLNSPDVDDLFKKAIKNQWNNITPEEQKAIHDKYIKKIEPAPAPAPAPTPAPAPAPAPGSGDMQFQGDNLVYNGRTYKPSKKLPGSTNPTLYVGEDNKPAFVVKEGTGPEQNMAEYVANRVYRDLQLDLPSSAVKSKLVDGKLVNDYLPGKTLDQLTPEEFNQFDIASKMRKSLVADALVANWDFAGLSNDNVMVLDNGQLYRIDSGGTFNFRAQGESKSFTPLPMEMWTLRGSQGKQFWANADDSDYKDLWTNQIGALMENEFSLKNIVNFSKLDTNAKAAFQKRLKALIIAGDEISKSKNDIKSWQAVDSAIKKAFVNFQNEDPNNPNWGSNLREEIKKQLQPLLPAPKPQQKSTYNLDNLNFGNYKIYINSANQQIKNTDSIDEVDKAPYLNLSNDEKYALYSYTGSAYRRINDYLRFGNYSSDEAKEYAEQVSNQVQSALNNLPADTGVVYRINATNFTKRPEIMKAVKNLKPGDIIETKGFDSYSRDDSGQVMSAFSKSENTHFHYITAYQGKNVHYVEPITSNTGEEESLMKKNTRLRVAKIETIPVSTFPELKLSSEKILLITYEDA